MRDRWRGLTYLSPAAIIHALHWACGDCSLQPLLHASSSPRAIPFFPPTKKNITFILSSLVYSSSVYCQSKHPHLSSVPKHHLPVLGPCLSPHWM